MLNITQKPLSVKTISLSALKRPFRVKTFGSQILFHYLPVFLSICTFKHLHEKYKHKYIAQSVAIRITHLCEHVIIYHDLSAIYFNDI